MAPSLVGAGNFCCVSFPSCRVTPNGFTAQKNRFTDERLVHQRLHGFAGDVIISLDAQHARCYSCELLKLNLQSGWSGPAEISRIVFFLCANALLMSFRLRNRNCFQWPLKKLHPNYSNNRSIPFLTCYKVTESTGGDTGSQEQDETGSSSGGDDAGLDAGKGKKA